MRKGLNKGLSLLVLASLLAGGPVGSSPPQGASRQGDRHLCRTPAALPQLPPETSARDQGQYPVPRPGRPIPMDERARAVAAPELAEGAVDSAPPPPPPPAPPPPAMAPPDMSDAIATTARKADGGPASADAAKVAPVGPDGLPYGPRPWPRPQAGQLTAGEHDDLLNPELYADYVRRSNLGQAIPGLPRLDTARVLTVAVHDRAGRPVPFAPVELACADGGRLVLNTTADGTVAFFPETDALGSQVRVRTAGEDWRDVAIPARRGAQRIDFTLDRQAAAVRKLDLMLVIDTTGSMGDEIRYLQTELSAIIDSLRARHQDLDLRVGFVFYRDLGDDYVTATVPLSSDIARAQGELRQRWAGGGGDYPEAMEQALIRAAGQQWRGDAVKTMLLVADAPPHDENVAMAWRAAEHLRAQRVHIVPVGASGVADTAEYTMRAMAALTQSRYTFLTDDSGIGNPHAAPAIDCYLVTRLDALLRRVIDSQLSGRRIEPDRSEVIREVGQYDGGRCVIPRGYGQE